jgi:hypothetical protein
MKTVHCLLLLFVLGACKEKYNSPYHLPPAGYLVVEGFINVGNGPTNISLSRVTTLDSPVIIPQTGAQVSVESQEGSSYPLSELGNGKYSISQIPVDLTQQYRLQIITPDSKVYLSGFTAPKVTPLIDSVSWSAAADGATIYVSSHDPQNNTKYYQWEYEETWEYTSAYQSGYEYVNGTIVARPDSDQLFICWKSDTSTSISIGTSAALNTDVISEFPLAQVPYSTNKLSVKYSILVKQYALTEDWYNWDEKVQKNTEQLGSIFDAQPSEIAGNLQCISNPGEQVIGFIGCTTETEKRIFISRFQLPNSPVIYSGYGDCGEDTVKNDPFDLNAAFSAGSKIPIGPVYKGPVLIGYLASGASCVDCRLMGGMLMEPPFWQ